MALVYFPLRDSVVAAEANPGGGLTVRVTFGGASLG
ncbi:hypothetical protein HNR40_002679 [Nonomuraea endophytica]|uniref:Uncharacterized protein n=1 Tax=Nonomuraea endophytica TaxID=714136 RepID=A0A7W8A0D7_9ACTN|nr:hypothetical protein [Nonomuraea endophytica]